MSPRHPFHDPATHGFVRVAAATPGVAVSDPTCNADFAIELAERAHAEHVDLVVFPELNLSSYAIDDLHLQDGLLKAVDAALARVVEASTSLRPVLLVGAPLVRNGRAYNCAAVVAHGELLGVVPKSFLPNYREYYEKRWFAPGAGIVGEQITAAGRTVPFGTDLRFVATDHDGFDLFVEICEDYWAPTPPSSIGALAGALILANLSASNIVIGKARDRALLCASQSMRTQSAYVYSAAGPGESTTDLAWDGQGLVYELGELLVASERFLTEPDLVVADVDAARIRLERMRTGTFNDAAAANDHPERRVRTVTFEHRGACERSDDDARYELRRPVARFPFVPDDPERLDADCYEAFNIQVEGLVTRFRATRGEHVVIGVSGGLDSTHALVVAARAFDRMGIDRSKILGYTMPGFATSDTTKTNAWALMRALGITAEEIDIRPAARQMLADMRHPFADGEHVYDVTFENVQAGLRTDYLFRLANNHRGFVVGTGDLSEIALGWSTYGVGDQMSHYNVNSGVPKTLIQHLIRWAVRTGEFDDEETDRILLSILDTVISPELVPAHEDAETDEPAMQSTEDQIGPYELHDFFLHHIARQGLAPSKVAFLAWHAWRDRQNGRWPDGFPDEKRNEYDLDHIRSWLEAFLQRFFGFSQFKRSAMPNGPKVSGGGSLSPRGDWRAPSDASAAPWLAELAAGLPPADG
ncbi:MAG TPA: NAD(+) synthase [Acidimicrobiales bacterium]|nr:NAD(+) synthase [Acidimicrobiales bacterium]